MIDPNHTGVFTLPVISLREPPPHLKVRDVKQWYVQYLVQMLLNDEGDHEDLTAPLLVIASVTRENFKQKDLHKYTYTVRNVWHCFVTCSQVMPHIADCMA